KRRKRAAFKVVVPGKVPELGWNVAPGNHEYGVALRNRISNQGILRPQVKDVGFGDARRDDEQRTPEYGGRRRRVLDQLDQLVLENDAARCRRQITPYLECGLIGHGDPAALRVGDQV